MVIFMFWFNLAIIFISFQFPPKFAGFLVVVEEAAVDIGPD